MNRHHKELGIEWNKVDTQISPIFTQKLFNGSFEVAWYCYSIAAEPTVIFGDNITFVKESNFVASRLTEICPLSEYYIETAA